MRDPFKPINNLGVIFKRLSSMVLVLFWIGLSVYLVFPKIINSFIPRVLEVGPVFGETHTYYSLDPLIANEKLSGEVNMEDLYWELDTRVIETSEVTMDPRKRAVEIMLIQYDSPMAPYAADFVEASDKHGNDWRLAVSITGVESAFGRITPANSYNGWGWRGGENGAFSKFNSWEHSIKYVTERLAVGYGTDITPMEMESTYCPPCGATGKHYWARGVENYMYILEQYRKQINGEITEE
jgi:hypothetical protein